MVKITMQLIRSRMMAVECYSIEVSIIVAALWAAKALLATPSPFDTFPAGFAVALRYNQDVTVWAAFVLVSAALLAAGFVLGFCGFRRAGIGCRVVGLWGSVVFWSVMSGSVLLAYPEAIFAAWGVIAVVAALWLLVRWPSEV